MKFESVAGGGPQADVDGIKTDTPRRDQHHHGRSDPQPGRALRVPPRFQISCWAGEGLRDGYAASIGLGDQRPKNVLDFVPGVGGRPVRATGTHRVGAKTGASRRLENAPPWADCPSAAFRICAGSVAQRTNAKAAGVPRPSRDRSSQLPMAARPGRFSRQRRTQSSRPPGLRGVIHGQDPGGQLMPTAVACNRWAATSSALKLTPAGSPYISPWAPGSGGRASRLGRVVGPGSSAEGHRIA